MRHGSARTSRPPTPTLPRKGGGRRTPRASSPRRRYFDLGGRKHIFAVAEFAGDGDHAVLDHVAALVLRKALQHVAHAVARARAFRLDIGGSEHAHAVL